MKRRNASTFRCRAGSLALKPADFLSFLLLFSGKVPLFLTKLPKFFDCHVGAAHRYTNKGCENAVYVCIVWYNVVTLQQQFILIPSFHRRFPTAGTFKLLFVRLHASPA